jgi:hypothetical protein
VSATGRGKGKDHRMKNDLVHVILAETETLAETGKCSILEIRDCHQCEKPKFSENIGLNR